MATPTPSVRDNWGSKLAFVLAAAGSAIGLGNIWRFPTVAADHGGGAFLVIYLICVLCVALPVMLAELVVGRASERNPVGAFKRLRPGTPWFLVGGLGVVTGVAILSFYSVVAGWTLYYFYKTVTFTFAGEVDTAAFFDATVANPGIENLFHALFMVITILIVAEGIRGGIERVTKILMPVLFILLIFLVVRALTLPGGEAGLSYYLQPDFSRIDGQVVLRALGQAFFSLSLGMGAMITYGSYISKRDNLASSAGYVAGFDTLIAVLAGLAIFPALFFAGLSPGEGGPGMIFQVLPQVFAQMPGAPWGGVIFGSAFFFLLSVAALTSAISLLEVVVAYFVDERRWPRKKAAWIMGGLCFLIGVPSALSSGASEFLSELPVVGMAFLDLMNLVFGDLSLVLGALGLAIFVGWVWGLGNAAAEISSGNPRFRLLPVWGLLMRFVAPAGILAILAFLLYSEVAS